MTDDTQEELDDLASCLQESMAMDYISERYVARYEVVDGPTKKVRREKGLEASGFGEKLEKSAKGFFVGNEEGNGCYYHSLEEIADDLVQRQEKDREAGINTEYFIIPHHPLGKHATKIAPLSCSDGEKLQIKIKYEPLSEKELAYLQQRLD